MFWYLPSKVQNLALVILSVMVTWRVIGMLEDDITFLLNGDDRSLFIFSDDDSTWYGVCRYVFQLVILLTCARTLHKNSKAGKDTVI
jgi:hypothetical protein